jgi:hypothetical protein
MATTTNYGWDTPDDTDLVKDGALAMRDLGQDVDTSLFSISGGKNNGLLPIFSQTFSGVSTVSVSNIFTSSYRNYKIIIDNCVGVVTNGLYLRFRQNTTDYSTSNYQNQFLQASGSTIAASRSGALSYGELGTNSSGSDRTVVQLDVFNPQIATYTHAIATTFCGLSGVGPRIDTAYNWVYNTQVFDGFTFYSSGGTNISGNLTVYALRNS